MANALLIWDNNKSYAEKLSADLGISYPDDVVFSIAEFEKNKFLKTKDCIVVLLETNIEGEHRTNFKGIEIIKTLRKDKRYKGLIVAYSTYTEEHFRNRKDAKILFTSGTRLRRFTKKGIDADEIENLILNVPKLSEDLLDDIHYNVFDTKGIIHELLHNLKNELTSVAKESSINQIIESANHKFEDYKKQLLREIDPQNIPDFNNLFSSLVSETNADIEQHWKDNEDKTSFKYSNAGNQISKFTNQIVALAPKSNEDEENTQDEKINWQVLFYDDEDDIRIIVEEYFDTKGVKCHVAANEKEVYEKLKENGQLISLFISDIRLKEKNGNWFDRQGYDVIEQVSQRNDYPLVYSVLTSKKGSINKRVQKKGKYDVLWFTKEDVLSNKNSFNIFFEAVKDYAEDNFNSNNVYQPDLSSWNGSIELNGEKKGKPKFIYPYKTYYKHHKQSPNSDYFFVESTINKQVLDFIESHIVKDGKSLGDVDFPNNWRCNLHSEVIDKTELDKFRYTKILGRRLVLAMLFAYKGIKPERIYTSLYPSQTTPTENDLKQLFPTHLKISMQFENVVNTICDFAEGKNKSPNILKEEFDFIKAEFWEESISNIEDLGEDYNRLIKIVCDIKEVFTNKSLPIPNTLTRVKFILDNDSVPKIERFDKMLSEVILIDAANNIINEISQTSPFREVENSNFRNLFLRHKFISF